MSLSDVSAAPRLHQHLMFRLFLLVGRLASWLLGLAGHAVQVVIQNVKSWRIGTVHFVPPLARELLLIENSAVGAEETVLDTSVLTEVDHLAGGLGVGVVARQRLVLARERCLGNGDKGWVVLTGNTGDAILIGVGR